METEAVLRIIGEFTDAMSRVVDVNRQLRLELAQVRRDLETLAGEVSGTSWVGTGRAAEHLGVSENLLRDLSNQGKIPHSMVGNVRRYHLPTLDRYLREGSR